METNLPVLRIGASIVNQAVRARCDSWVSEVYLPRFVKQKECLFIDRYVIARETPGYPVTMNITYWENLNSFGHAMQEPEILAIRKDMRTTWFERYGGENIFDAMYFLSKSFISDKAKLSGESSGMGVENAPFIHITAFDLSPEEETRYEPWLTKMGYQVYFPLFMSVPGPRRIDCLKHTGEVGMLQAQESVRAYPLYAIIFHFESLESSDEFDRSTAMAALHEGIKTNFPVGLRLKWNVKYQLIKSFRK